MFSRDKTTLSDLIKNKLERVSGWLSKSGMKVNEAKTSLCLFYNRDTTPIGVELNGVIIRSKTNINVLGVIFDQKLQWSDHVSHCVSKSNKCSHMLTGIRPDS